MGNPQYTDKPPCDSDRHRNPQFHYKSLFYLGWKAFAGNEGNIFGQMPGRSKDEPDYPDYQLIQVSVSQDKAFIEYGLQQNFKREVCLIT
jgi:hypothetical protein